MESDKNPILEEAKEKMDIVPYTRRDRIVTWTILIVAGLNLILLIATISWGAILP